MIKAKRIKLFINLGAISAIAIAGGVTAKIISDNSSDKAMDLNVIIASRGDNSVINTNNVEVSDENSSNKDNNLKEIKDEKIEENTPVDNQPKESEPAPPAEKPKEPDPEPIPDPVEAEPNDPEEDPKNKVFTDVPGHVDNPLTPSPVIDQPIIVVSDPEPNPEPAPAPEIPKPPSIEDQLPKATEGYVNIDSLPNFDFSTTKPKENPKGELTAKQKETLKKSVSTLVNITKNLPSKFTKEEIQQINDAIYEIRKLNAATKNEKKQDWTVLLENLYANDGRPTSEKAKAIGWPYINDAYNFPLDFKNMWADIQRNLDSFLEKGMVPSIHWGSGHSWGFIDISDNVVRNKIIQDHESRYFPYNTEWTRTPASIKEMNYEGFRKDDVTRNYARYGANASNGITVLEYTPEGEFAKSKIGDKKVIAVLDASNRKGYNSFLQFLKNAEANGKKIDGIVIKNMGLIDQHQDFSQILAQMPNSIQKLTLFFEGKDTSSLIGLKDKTIQELDLYNSNNTIADDWGINPYALRGVKKITFDYNHESITSGTHVPNNKDMPGSIVFNTLKFDKNMNLDQINEGLKIALKDRYGERIFQGQFGDGSWPTYLDFSNLPQIRSLEDMNFYTRVFKKLTLYNKTNVFSVDASRLHKQQWSAMLIKGPERPKLYFVSPQPVNTLYIKGNAVDLGNNWGVELYGLIESGKDVFQTVYVDNDTMARVLNDSQAFRQFNKIAKVKPADFNNSVDNSIVSFD
ncbi:putative immunoglobulin-blocking virulence protein [Mycoplasma sp. 1018B]|uniref:putative immunoglobulin-blocking virulence protein n=1 Tax=Mycoplasma sp. 1018B TaxID=2967302 RepID=UPI00211BC110|nr:putative immunoglobulin-blocking virulence protein [Mycoplasma sp. 1018B]UUM19427.1 putative immunoglobulin-blocking virulence protein [Mycoplasma sp. 1018B]